MPEIRFTRTGSSAVFGNFGPGDRLRCSEADARHFVCDALAAEYVEALVVEEPAAVEEAAAPAKPKRAARLVNKEGA